MRAMRLMAGLVFLTAGMGAADAGAAELKVLSAEAMKPALQELAPAFEKASGHKLKIDYASDADVQKKVEDAEDYDVVIVDKPGTEKLRKGAKIVGGTRKDLTSDKGPKGAYIASSPMLTEQPVAAKALIDFLGSAKATEVYKAKGLSS